MNTSGHNFEVNVPSGFSNPDSQKLSETERDAARTMGISEEQFRQGKLELFRSDEMRRQRGLDLGKEVEGVLAELGAGYRLASVTWNTNTKSWRLEVSTPSGSQNVVLGLDLVDGALDYKTRNELQRVRNMVLFGLGRQELIFKH